jgi:prepilin-type N-terminal cleavage/methylation domain-containing protein/prepilin-type processing-associated H-X9-DG protein
MCISPRASSRPRRGFTLVELLVVVGVITVLLGLLLPSVNIARASGRRVECVSNLRQLGICSTLYVGDHNGYYWRYKYLETEGVYWWFGFEPGGPGSGKRRPIDLTKCVFWPYLGGKASAGDEGESPYEKLMCPSFPYDDARYFEKFDRKTASYGVNVRLCPWKNLMGNTTDPSMRRRRFGPSMAQVFLLADSIHFESTASFNEGHYITALVPPIAASGYAHFRHRSRANTLFLDGHVGARERVHGAYGDLDIRGAASNLVGDDGRCESIDGRDWMP